MKIFFPKTVLLLAALLAAGGLPSARAAFISLQASGTVTACDDLPGLVGQTWTMKLVYDAATLDEAPGTPSYGFYPSRPGSPAIRSLDLTIGSSGAYAIHLVDPVDFNDNIRIDIDNGVNAAQQPTKTFFAHVFDQALLPVWDGNQLKGFTIALFDQGGGGYADGLDTLPTNTALTRADFTGADFSLALSGNGALTGAVTSVNFAVVPEPSSGGLAGAGAIALLVTKRLRTMESAITLRGTVTGPVTSVKVRAGRNRLYRLAKGTNSWSFRVRGLKPGRNVVSVIASGAAPATPAAARVTIQRQSGAH